LIYLVGARGFEPPTTCTPCIKAICMYLSDLSGFIQMPTFYYFYAKQAKNALFGSFLDSDIRRSRILDKSKKQTLKFIS